MDPTVSHVLNNQIVLFKSGAVSFTSTVVQLGIGFLIIIPIAYLAVKLINYVLWGQSYSGDEFSAHLNNYYNEYGNQKLGNDKWNI